MTLTPSEVKSLMEEMLSSAANFKRVDLHIHSDESPDFPRANDFGVVSFNPSDVDKRKPVEPRHFITSAIKKNLDLICITDHMRSRKSCEIARENAEEVVCLPGIEVNIRISQTTEESIHLICVFKEGKSPEDIERIFEDSSGLPNYVERKVDSKIFVDISRFVKKVHGNDGICIASHVNDENGLRSAFYDTDFEYVILKRQLRSLQAKKDSGNWNQEDDQELKALKEKSQQVANRIQEKYLVYLIENDIDAVQVQKSSDFQFYRGPYTQHLAAGGVAAILSTDAHCLDAIGYKGKITYVKMEKCSFENLKAALRDPQTRIRYSDNVETHRYPRIKGLVFLGEDGFFKPISNGGKPQALGFADNLTCFIGGRGSGKSATIDALRFIFRGKDEVESLRPALKKDVYDRSDHTLNNTGLYILMESPDSTQVVVHTFYQGWDAKNYESWFVDGSSAGIDLSVSEDYRVEIYGWSEIEDLGTDSNKQRELLDKFIPEVPKIRKDILEMKSALESNRNNIILAAKELETLIPKVKDYPEAKAAFERINTPEMQARFAQIDALNEKQNRMKKLRQEMESLEERLAIEETKKKLQTAVQELKADLDENLKTWAQTVLERIFEPRKGGELLEQVTELLEKLKVVFADISKRAEAEEANLNKESEALKGQLSTVVGLNIDEVTAVEKRNAFKKRYDDIKDQKKKIKEKRELIEKFFGQRHSLLEQFVKFQEVKSQKRQDKKDEINGKIEKNIKAKTSVRIDFRPLGSKEVFEDRLGIRREGRKKDEGILKGVGPKYMERHFAEIISAHMMPRDFTKKIMENDIGGLILRHLDGKAYIDESNAQKIINHLSPIAELYGERYFDSEKLGILLELEEIEYEDLPEIKLNNDPIMGLSPGQRCSALVPIILLQGNCPLIIDQPEDNLDNKLVFDLVVDILRSLKEFRQIIVATHNPNIPVSGDAEQIILFESVDRKTGKAEHQGSIDNEIMISKVKEVMEGGELAFHTRAQKYRYSPQKSIGWK